MRNVPSALPNTSQQLKGYYPPHNRELIMIIIGFTGFTGLSILFQFLVLWSVQAQVNNYVSPEVYPARISIPILI